MAKEQAYRLRRRMLIDAFGQRLGLCERYRQYAERELRSKPQPDAGRPCVLPEDRPAGDAPELVPVPGTAVHPAVGFPPAPEIRANSRSRRRAVDHDLTRPAASHQRSFWYST